MSGDSKATVISAFSEEQVSRLTGLSVDRLRYWDRTAFFSPSFAADNRRIAFSRVYSFTDIAALRVLSVLINQHNVPVSHLRKASGKLGSMDNGAWHRTTLYVMNRKVIFDDPEGGHQREVVSGQYMIGIPLERVISDTKKDVRALSARSETQIGRVSKNRLVSHNAAVVAGTRVPIRSIREFGEAGYSPEQIVKEYPTLTVEDVKAVLGNNRAA
ncbi:DUF433 domain-containing protein [Rhizobium bangladeshense]|uniref:DUF433 domain-containing protein n=1 Tax=Rhizobium bangladeshense TaxID=1138189 RepID=UPI0007E532CE|nr:DUF433 domain-containing protein [Rhizobium bangladeshense]